MKLFTIKWETKIQSYMALCEKVIWIFKFALWAETLSVTNIQNTGNQEVGKQFTHYLY